MTSGIYIRTKENIENLSKSHLGNKHTEETKKKIKKSILENGIIPPSRKGIKQTDKHKKKIKIALTGRKLTQQHMKNMIFGKQNISKTDKKNAIRKMVETRNKNNSYIHSEDTKKQMRVSAIKRIEKQYFYVYEMMPCIGKNESLILDILEKKQNIKILRQYKVAGFFVDGYCQDLNTVYEIDEPYHFDIEGNISKRDIRRQEIIMSELNCKFIRIEDKGYEVDKNEVWKRQTFYPKD